MLTRRKSRIPLVHQYKPGDPVVAPRDPKRGVKRPFYKMRDVYEDEDEGGFSKDEKSGHRTNQRRAARNVFKSAYDLFGRPIAMIPYLYVMYYFWKFGDMHSREIHQNLDIQNLPEQGRPEGPGV